MGRSVYLKHEYFFLGLRDLVLVVALKDLGHFVKVIVVMYTQGALKQDPAMGTKYHKFIVSGFTIHEIFPRLCMLKPK